LLIALRHSSGMSRTQIRDAFSRNMSGIKIDNALRLLEEYKKAKMTTRPPGPSGGKPAQVWAAL
jgi:hypothetical protein